MQLKRRRRSTTADNFIPLAGYLEELCRSSVVQHKTVGDREPGKGKAVPRQSM
jgi:hypothetical protein